MQIAIVCDYFLDFVGGAQTSIREQKLALEEAGHTVVLVTTRRGRRGPAVERQASGLRLKTVYTLPGVDLPVVHADERTIGLLTDYFREEQIDVVHVQTEFGLAHASAAAAERLGIPVVHTVHTFYWASDSPFTAPLTPVMRVALWLATRRSLPRLRLTKRTEDNILRNLTLDMALRADAVVSPSAHQALDLEAAGVPAPVLVVPNPIATSPRPAVPLSAAQAQHPRFLWVARCESVKRPLLFAQAAVAALARTGGGFSVDFVGDGTELAALRKLVAGHPRLRVHGALPHSRVLDLMDEASAVVLSSLGFDNQPMTIAEAVSRERGVLYCDPKLREGLTDSGFLSSNPDAEGLADALVALVSDPSLLLELSRGAAAEKAEFSPERYVEHILEVYRSARHAVER
ncbi:glycosyltransferase family 4 protein [Parafrigoribacterium mesophilum]|uniref:glycosyltransferase family 4 protein n=1 Tax=Parafrigoribacterium mesophilum TaxID=433646 RepID=UPI0031FCCFF8